MPAARQIAAEELERLYLVEKLSTEKIAERIGWPYASTVLRHLKRHGIPVRSNSEASSLRRPTPEHVEKRVAAMRGRPSGMSGKKWSAARRRRQAELWADPAYREKMSSAQRGPRSSRWRGGFFVSTLGRGEWRRRRRECYERDRWRCRDCDVKCTPASERKRNGKTTIQAHHLIARRDGGSDDLDNLITLCMSCHHRRERAASKE